MYASEWNFRNIIKEHLAKLLNFKTLNWKKRFSANKIKFGDECTKFFHAMATVCCVTEKNRISQLKDESALMI